MDDLVLIGLNLRASGPWSAGRSDVKTMPTEDEPHGTAPQSHSIAGWKRAPDSRDLAHHISAVKEEPRSGHS